MAALEKHHSIPEIAKAWQLDPDTVRKHFINHPGVVKIIRPETRKKRAYTTLRVPESVLQKVHEALRGGKVHA